jgi:hypothetical protein
MALETVRVVFLDTEVVPALVDGVVVRVFDADNNLITMATSGAVDPGTAQLELEGDTAALVYQLRFYLPGSAVTPKLIEVFSPASLSSTGTNDFSVSVEVFALETATEPQLCRASGYVTGPSGRARVGVDLIFLPKFNAFVDETSAALPGRFIVRTNKYGFASVDLYRSAMYQVTIAGREEVVRNIEVPDRSSVLLGHLLFPVVVAVEYVESGPYTVAVDQSLFLTPHVRSSDFRALGVGPEDVLYSITDQAIASVQISGDRIVVRGLAAGTTSLRVTRLDNSIVYLPDLGIAGGDVQIVVT